jgi:hypothetical protein
MRRSPDWRGIYGISTDAAEKRISFNQFLIYAMTNRRPGRG